MFTPCSSSLLPIALFPVCFPRDKLLLSFLALEKRLYLREQDTDQGIHFVRR